MNLRKLKIQVFLILSQQFKDDSLIQTDEMIYEGNVALDEEVAELWSNQVIDRVEEQMGCKGKKKKKGGK